MNKFLTALMATTLLVGSAMAADPVKVKVENDLAARNRPWHFHDVKILDQKREVVRAGVYENLVLKTEFEADLRTLGGAGKVLAIELVQAQKSPDNILNPSEFQFKVKSTPVSGPSITSAGSTKVRFERTDYLTQRKAGAEGWPFLDREFEKKQRVYYFLFDAGTGTKQAWHMYKFDFRDTEKATLEFDSTFAYVQGKVEVDED